MFFEWEDRQPRGGAVLFGEFHTSLELWGKLVEHKLSLFIVSLMVSLLDFFLHCGSGVRVQDEQGVQVYLSRWKSIVVVQLVLG